IWIDRSRIVGVCRDGSSPSDRCRERRSGYTRSRNIRAANLGGTSSASYRTSHFSPPLIHGNLLKDRLRQQPVYTVPSLSTIAASKSRSRGLTDSPADAGTPPDRALAAPTAAASQPAAPQAYFAPRPRSPFLHPPDSSLHLPPAPRPPAEAAL